MESLNILETVCYPAGCMINEEMQTMLALVLVPKLKEAGLTTAEYTRGATLLEEPYFTKVKSIVCHGCGHTSCQYNGKYSPIGEDDPLRVAFRIPYGERMNFDQKVLDQILPEDEVRKLESNGLKVSKWMSSSRNQIYITIEIGGNTVRYSTNLRKKWTDFSVNNEGRPVPTSIDGIRATVKEIMENNCT